MLWFCYTGNLYFAPIIYIFVDTQAFKNELHGDVLAFTFFSSPEHEVLRVSYCDHSSSVGVRRPPVVHSHFLVYTLASTNINQLAPNLVQMYMTIRSRMNSIMDLIGPELSELSALELENLLYLTLFTL